MVSNSMFYYRATGEKFTGSKEGLSISIYEFKWCEQYEQPVLDDWKGDEALF